MNINKYLPIELVNKILIMRPSHPISIILKPCINSYIGSDDNGDYYFSFFVYTLDEILNDKLYNNVNKENILKEYYERSRDFKIKEGLAHWAP